MTTVSYPFSPTFGFPPYTFAGRKEILDEFHSTFQQGPGASGLTTLLAGARGTGKTVLLEEFTTIARETGWLILNEYGTPEVDGIRPGLISRLTDTVIPQELQKLNPRIWEKVISSSHSISLGPVGVSSGRTKTDTLTINRDFRWQLAEVTKLMNKEGKGVLIAIDEIQNSNPGELTVIGEVVQLLKRERLNIGFIAAGLESGINELVTHPSTTFLSRARRHKIGPVASQDIREAFRKTVEDNGRTISEEALSLATKNSRNFPFLMQLVGSYSWGTGVPGTEITTQDVIQGSILAKTQLKQDIHMNLLRMVPGQAKEFLYYAALIVSDGKISMSQLAQKWGKESRYVSVYRDRLIKQGIIEPHSYGTVAFTVPLLEETIISEFKDEVTTGE